MLPQTQVQAPRNSSKVNLLISFAVHTALVLVLIFFAARQGFLGRQLRKITVQMVKETPPEKPKEPEKPRKAEMPKEEPPKVQRLASAPKPAQAVKEVAPAPAPVTVAPPVVAPPVGEMPSLVFDGGKTVQTSSDPVQLYKGALEYALRAKWNRPADISDDNYVDEVEISVDHNGDLSRNDAVGLMPPFVD